MLHIKWLEKALIDLEETAEHIAQDDAETAKKLVIYIKKRIELLAQHPSQGRQGRVTGTRELVIDKYPFIIPYRVRDNELQILRIFHTSRKPPKKW